MINKPQICLKLKSPIKTIDMFNQHLNYIYGNYTGLSTLDNSYVYRTKQTQTNDEQQALCIHVISVTSMSYILYIIRIIAFFF